MHTSPIIAITSGEPAGIGLDICLDLATWQTPCRCVVLGDKTALQQRAALLNKSITFQEYTPNSAPPNQPNVLEVLPINTVAPVIAGSLALPHPCIFPQVASCLPDSHASPYPPCCFGHRCKLGMLSALKPNQKYSFFHPDGWKPRNWDQCSLKVWVLNTDDVTLMSSPRGDRFGHSGR